MHKDREKRQHESENTQKWFVVHVGKGIVAVQSIPVSERCLKKPTIWFLYPALQSVRRMLYQNIEVAYATNVSYGLGGYSLNPEDRDHCPVPLLEADIHSPNWNGHTAHLAAFGPDIFRLVERNRMLPDEIISNHRMKFRMPFVDHQKYEGPVFSLP